VRKTILYKITAFLILAFSFSLLTDAQEYEMMDTVKTETSAENEEEFSAETASDQAYPDTLTSRLRAIPGDTIKLISSDKGFYYKNYIDSLLKARQKIRKDVSDAEAKVKEDSFFQSFLELISWIFAIGLLFYMVYKLFLTNSSLFSRSRKNVSGDTLKIQEENLNDPEAGIQQAVAAGNYRLAVRYLYLQTLRNLADKKFIELGSEKTNYRYVNEVRKHSFANEFASLTLAYEYTWYGEYPVDKNLFEQIHSSFKNFSRHTGR
jgi:hypothetical protein